MKLSDRMTHITGGGSDGWDTFYRARRMIASGINVTELNIGEHDTRTHPDILHAMQQAAMNGHTGYATVPGTDSLRAAIAQRIADRTGVTTTGANILVTPGGQAGLFAAHNAVCDQGDIALFIDPYYVTYPGTIRSVGAIPKPIVTTPETGFQPTYSALQAAAAGAKSLLINSPNNPTGAVYTADTMNTIAAACQDHDLWLISDEVYDTQIWEGRHISPRVLPGMVDRTLVVGSMSKSHAMTGSRIGWICAPEEVIAHLTNLATHTTYGVAGYIQDAAEFALGQGARIEDAVAEPFRRRRALSLDALVGQDTVKAVPSQGAMYLMLDIRATGLTGEGFANALLDTAQIAVMPGESFGQAAAGHIRIAMTIDDDRYVAALERIIAFAAAKAKQ